MKKRVALGSLSCFTQPVPSGTKNILIFFEAKEPSIQKMKNGASQMFCVFTTPIFVCQQTFFRQSKDF